MPGYPDLACPACLSPLASSGPIRLSCRRCGGQFPVYRGVPVVLLDDEHRRHKADEVRGEVDYNINEVPAAVHRQRVAFEDRVTEEFLAETGTHLIGARVLCVGSSYDEVLLLNRHSARVCALDLTPALVAMGREAAQRDGVEADWVCGDGEALPFADESFDAVFMRQALHHMFRYYTALSECFRVCRVGGLVLIVDEPLVPIDPRHCPLNVLPGHYQVYGGVRLRALRLWKRFRRAAPPATSLPQDFARWESTAAYRPPTAGRAETFLADKYLSLSLLDLIYGLRLHTDTFELHWPSSIAHVEGEGGAMRFIEAPHPYRAKPLWRRLCAATTVSVNAQKEYATTALRSRKGCRPLAEECARALCGAGGGW